MARARKNFFLSFDNYCSILSTAISALHKHFKPYFTNGATKTERGEATCPRSSNRSVAEPEMAQETLVLSPAFSSLVKAPFIEEVILVLL